MRPMYRQACSALVVLAWMAAPAAAQDSKSADAATRMVAFAYLLVWYFAAARSQSTYVKERFGKDYPRKGWGKPLLIAVAGLVGYIVLAAVVGYIVAVVRPA